MALRSGYYGLKNSVKKALEKLAADTAGMKIIKSFGDGLSLSNAGKLSVTAGTANKIGGFKVGSGLSVLDGVLSVQGGANIFSGEEVDTGWRIGDKPVYARYMTANTYSTGVSGCKIGEINDVVRCLGIHYSIDYSETATGFADLMGSYYSGSSYFPNGGYSKIVNDKTEIWIAGSNAFGAADAKKDFDVLVFYYKKGV